MVVNVMIRDAKGFEGARIAVLIEMKRRAWIGRKATLDCGDAVSCIELQYWEPGDDSPQLSSFNP